MISEMKKSFKAILYERVTSPLSGIFILSWLIFNWKPCLVLAFGDDSIYKRILFVHTTYTNIYNNIYYPALYSVAFILIYPWVTLGPFYIWQKSNYLKSKIKIKFELQTPLTLEQSIELRKEMRQKEIEFTEMLSAKNSKQLELEAYIQNLETLLKESENQLLLKEANSDDKSTINAEEQKWNLEYENVYKRDTWFLNYLDDALEAVANCVTIGNNAKKYCFAEGLINIDASDKISLSKKGEYLSKFTNNSRRLLLHQAEAPA